MQNRILPPLMDQKSVSPDFHFPPGFRFHPSDEELIVHYLHNKVTSRPLPALLIADIDLYKFNPWDLPKKALFGEDEWFFFSPRDRKYPNGARPNRAAASGYWKATGIDKPILVLGGSKNIGVKKSLVFYAGRPPKGTKTDWIMNEYRLPDTTTKPSRLKGCMRLDDWVLCRVRHKGSAIKNGLDNRDTENSDSFRYLQKKTVNVPERSTTHVVMVDHMYKDYQLMASLLAGQAIPATDTISTISFQGSNNLQNRAHDSSPNAVTSIAKAPKRLLAEQVITEESLTKRQHRDSSDVDDLLSMVLAESDEYNQLGEYQGMFDLQASDPFHNLNDLAFSDRVFGLEDN